MRTQLFFDLTASPECPAVHFRDAEEVEATTTELRDVFEIDGAEIRSTQYLFKAFAIALKKPDRWYGHKQFAPNAGAFLEYLDDAVGWVPASGHVVLVCCSGQFWRANTRLAGKLTGLWQFAAITRHATFTRCLFRDA